jgi:hypothetical protein
MRAVHLFAVSAVLVLGASLASVDRSQAQGLLEMAPPPPADGSARAGQPRYEDVKLETHTALPPKAGSAIFLDGGPMEMLMPRKKARKGAGVNAK